MEFRVYCCLLPFVLSVHILWSQALSILISGKVKARSGVGSIYQVIVLNQRTSAGLLANSNGEFLLQALKNDTILINAPGFIVKKLCFRDSVFKNKYVEQIYLDSLHYELMEVVISPKDNLQDVHEEENTLGVIPNTDLNKTYNTTPLLLQLLFFSIDIDALYEKWSHKEREKRRVAHLEDDELRRSILQELLRLYRRNNLIDIEDNQVDKFIDYCDFSDNFIKNSTDYDLATAIRNKLEQFQKLRNDVLPSTR